MRGAEAEARSKGYHVLVIERPLVGESRVVAKRHLEDVLVRIPAFPRPLCVISSGETTVTVKGEGRGGRNQELALAAAELLASSEHTMALASVGTDGVDGPTDAAGAVVDTTTIERARIAALGPPSRYLDANDSYTFFEAIGDLIQTGPTGTNVGDLQILLIL
jgi:hydroxypyruvate reductase